MNSRRTLLVSPLALLAGPASAAKLQWVTAEVPPFAWQGPRGSEGHPHELFVRLHRLAALVGELNIYPWARASRMLLGGQALG
jgi:hypothetical protein